MPKKIDRNSRRETIVRSALAVFEREGYRDSSLSMIAEESGISRPTVYQYFNDKNDIFYYALKDVTSRLFKTCSMIAWAENDSTEVERIKDICSLIFDAAARNRASMLNLMEFLISEKKDGLDIQDLIIGRTAKLRILIKRLVRQGIADGRIKKTVSPDSVASALFSIIAGCIMQFSVIDGYTPVMADSLVSGYLESIENRY